jgi:hypothetical protein
MDDFQRGEDDNRRSIERERERNLYRVGDVFQASIEAHPPRPPMCIDRTADRATSRDIERFRALSYAAKLDAYTEGQYISDMTEWKRCLFVTMRSTSSQSGLTPK